MATYLHGPRDPQRSPDQLVTANGFRILKQTLIWLDKWNDATYVALVSDEVEPLTSALYQSLVDLSRSDDAQRLIVGFGCLHEDPRKRAFPVYVAFAVTARGLAVATELFSRYQELTAFDPRDRCGPPGLPPPPCERNRPES